ncbi:hypothetical protein ACLOJK_033226 [Asimina triloba]
MAAPLHLTASFIPSSSKLRITSPSPAIAVLPPNHRNASRIRAKIREIFMPALSSTMTEGKIVSWIKSEGEKLSKGDSVVVVESDKADMDVETFYDGYLAAIIVDEGDVAAVGSAIALLAESEEEISEAKLKASTSSSSAAAATAPAAAEMPAEKSVTAAPPPPKAELSSAASSAHPASEAGRRIVATPYAKKLAKDLKVDLGSLAGSGPLGRIVAKDVEAAAAAGASAAGAVAAGPMVSARPESAKAAPTAVELGTIVPFTTMQAAVSRNMLESLAVPTFRVGYTITTDALDSLYKKVSFSNGSYWNSLKKLQLD